MPYDYQTERRVLFTDEGQRLFLRVRDATQRLLKMAGAASLGGIMGNTAGSFETWHVMACVDRLVELGEIREVTAGVDCFGQDRVFVEKP